MSKILDAVSIAVSYGLMGDVCAVMSPKAFEVLNADLSALRAYDQSYRSSQSENGSESLVFHAQTGKIKVLSSPFQKDGLCHIFVPEETKRIGATDATFVKRHGTSEALILESATTSGAEMRVYSHQALFVEAPRHAVVMAGITY